MAGVGIALPQDALAAATNPAGMAMVGNRTDFGLDWFKPTRNTTVTGATPMAGTYDGNGTSNFFIPEFGYNKMMNPDMSLGVSVYGNGGMNTDYATNPFAGLGAGTNPAGVNLEQLFIAPTWSMKLNPTNAVGVSLNLAYQTFEAKGLQAFGGFSNNNLALTNNGKDSSTGYGLHLGWTGQVTPNVTLGATYQTKTKMGKFSKYSGLFAEQGGFDIPETYGLGIAVKTTPDLTIAADIQQINYSKVPSVGNPIDNLNSCAGVGPTCLGGSNGAGFGWKDVTAFKLGASYAYSQNLTLRAGFSANNQPIPNSQTLFNILAPAVIQEHMTLGATWTLENKAELSLGYMHAFKKTVNGSGSMAIVGGGEANLNMYEDSIGIAYGWKL